MNKRQAKKKELRPAIGDYSKHRKETRAAHERSYQHSRKTYWGLGNSDYVYKYPNRVRIRVVLNAEYRSLVAERKNKRCD